MYDFLNNSTYIPMHLFIFLTLKFNVILIKNSQ